MSRGKIRSAAEVSSLGIWGRVEGGRGTRIWGGAALARGQLTAPVVLRGGKMWVRSHLFYSDTSKPMYSDG